MDANEVLKLAETSVTDDHSEQNRSSIALLLEHRGKSVLVPGDAADEQLLEAIDEVLSRRSEERLGLEAMVVPHGGSRTSMSRDLLDRIDCRRFLVSTNGARFGHPDPEAIARIVVHAHRPVALMFNYRTEQSDVWDDAVLKERFAYTTVYASDPECGLPVDVLEPRFEHVDLDPYAATLVQQGNEVRVTTSMAVDTVALEPRDLASLAGAIDEALRRRANVRRLGDDVDERELAGTLVNLAGAGARLRQRLLGPASGLIAATGAIQLVTADAGTQLPAEFVYDRDPPDDGAELCPNWRETLESGSCAGCEDTPLLVCPAAFWGLARSVERQVIASSARPVPNAPVDPLPFDSVLLAASERVDPKDVDLALAQISVAGPACTVATSWSEVRELISGGTWSVLALLGLRVEDRYGLPSVEVGGETIPLDRFADELGRHQTPGSLAIVIGGFDTDRDSTSIAGYVLQAGFSACITNSGPITGADAADGVARIVAELASPGDESTVADAVLRARRRLVASGNLLGLSLRCFGDLSRPIPPPASP